MSEDATAPTPSGHGLRATGLRLTRGGVPALRGLDVAVPAGELHALVGPSGCGKTSALRVLAGLERPDAGEVVLDGRPLAGPGLHVPPEARDVGLVFQDFALFPHVDVATNVGYGVARRERATRVPELLGLVGLAHLADRRPGTLSGGQQQRVALARALAPRPRALLLDEPFGGLDAALRTDLRTEVRDLLRRAGVAALLVTHDQEEALGIADALTVVRDGRALQHGTPADVYERPADPWVARFLGDASAVPAHGDGRVARSALGVVPLPDDAPARATGEVDLLLRPEAIVRDPAEGGVPATVVGREYRGHAQLVSLVLGDGTRLRALWPPTPDARPGDAVSIAAARALGTFAREGVATTHDRALAASGRGASGRGPVGYDVPLPGA